MAEALDPRRLFPVGLVDLGHLDVGLQQAEERGKGRGDHGLGLRDAALDAGDEGLDGVPGGRRVGLSELALVVPDYSDGIVGPHRDVVQKVRTVLLRIFAVTHKTTRVHATPVTGIRDRPGHFRVRP